MGYEKEDADEKMQERGREYHGAYIVYMAEIIYITIEFKYTIYILTI